MENNKSSLALIKEEINREIASPETLKSLVEITFKGLSVESAKRALLEGMMIGFTFKDFLQKNVYAIPYGQGYSLVGSIDYCRKIGMKSGVVGVSAPIYTEDEKKNILTCEITVKRMTGGMVGNFTALVYFNEYTTGRNQWATRPRTMISKVAEMHALRKACPEEMSQIYVEEEYEKDKNGIIDEEEKKKIEKVEFGKKMMSCQTIKELQDMWVLSPGYLKKDKEIVELKDKLKAELKTIIVETTINEKK